MNKYIKLQVLFLLISATGFSQKLDTVIINASNVNTKVLIPGTHRYLVYFKMGKDSSRKMYQLWTRKIDLISHENRDAISIIQEWEDNDSIFHTVRSVCDRKSFAPLYQESWWRGRGSHSQDFLKKEFRVNGNLVTSADTSAARRRNLSAFEQASNEFVLNWHLDLEVFSTLPYKQGAVFKLNLYDPGFTPPSTEAYTVTGSEKLITGFGEIDCWILEHGKQPQNLERFWINKKTKEVMKMEQEFNGRFRYKIKLGFSV